jgi:hypothetical protein
MNINIYNFLFHPLDSKHSFATKVLSSVTVIALSILTAGGFLLAFGLIQLRDRHVTQQPPNPKITTIQTSILQPQQPTVAPSSAPISNPANVSLNEPSNRVKDIKSKHKAQLELFEKWSREKDFKMFKPEHSHYDWWMFPVNRASASYGEKYAISSQELEVLKNDKEFMKDYRRGVELVIQSWGWNLQEESPVQDPTPDQKWTGYGVRLGKMAQSLDLFGEKELYGKVQKFFQAVCLPAHQGKLPLESWVIKVLSKT